MSDTGTDFGQLHGFRGRDPRVDVLWQRMEAWEELLARQASTLQDVRAGLGALRSDLEATERPAEAALAPEDPDAVFRAMDERFTALTRAIQPVLDGFGQRLSDVEDAPPPEPDLSALTGQLHRLDEGVAELRRILGEHGSRLDRRASDIQTLATAIRKLAAHVGYKGNLS